MLSERRHERTSFSRDNEDRRNLKLDKSENQPLNINNIYAIFSALRCIPHYMRYHYQYYYQYGQKGFGKLVFRHSVPIKTQTLPLPTFPRILRILLPRAKKLKYSTFPRVKIETTVCPLQSHARRPECCATVSNWFPHINNIYLFTDTKPERSDS